MKRHHRIRARRLALMAGVAAAVLAVGDAGFSPVRIALPLGEGRIGVEAVRLEGGLFAAARAQGAVTLENVTVDAGPSIYRLPQVTFEGSTLPREALLDLLRGKTDAAWHEVLAEVSADRVSAPELIVEQTIEDATTTLTYRDIVAEDVSDGVVARLAAAGADIAAEGPDGRPFSGTVGAMEVAGFDLPFTVRWYTDGAPQDEENPFRTFYESFSVDDLRFGDDEATVSVGRTAGETVSGRLMREPFTRVMPELEAMSADGEPSEADMRRMLGVMADMMGSLRVGPVVVEDVAVEVPDLGDEPIFRIDRIAFGGDEPARVETLRVDVEEAEIAIASIVSEGFSMEPMIEGMRRIADEELEVDAGTARALLPTIGTVRLEDLDAAIVPEGGTEPVAVALGAFAMTAEEPVDGAPTHVRLSFDNLAFVLPADSAEEGVVRLRALGYEDLDLSGSFAARWNAETEEVAIEEASLSGVEMGRVALSGAFGNIGPEAFSQDQMTAMMAWLGASARNLRLSVVDEGLAERLLAMQADEQGVSAEDLRAQGAMMARAMLPAMLGGTPEARALGDALAAFVEAPGELDVVVTAADPEGIPVMQFGQVENPLDLLPLVSIEAQAR